jgi:hypothetical protein
VIYEKQKLKIEEEEQIHPEEDQEISGQGGVPLSGTQPSSANKDKNCCASS